MKYVITIEADSAEELREITTLLANRDAEPAPEVKSAPDGVLIAEGTTTEVKGDEVTEPETTATREEETSADEGDAAVDADGMPWNGDYHASSRAMTADGLWKAARGKAVAARQAREQFKAGGANEEAPADVETREAPAAPGMPGLPGAAAPATEVTSDVRTASLEDVVTAAQAALDNERISGDALLTLYTDVTGAGTPEEAFEMFKEDNDLRVELLDEIQALDE